MTQSSTERKVQKNAGAKQAKRDRDKKAVDGRELRRRFEQAKKKTWEYEKKNHGKLIIFRSTNNWWKMGGVSALVYKNVLAPRLKKEPSIREDTDFFATFEDGVISIPSIDGFKDDMRRLELKISSETDVWVAYDLGWKVTDGDIKQWREAEREAKRKLQQIIMPDVPDPKLWLEILTLTKIIYENVRKENAVMRECHGKVMIEEADNIVRTFMQMSRGKKSKEEAISEIERAVNELELKMIMVIELRVWEMSAQGRFAEQLAKIKEIIFDNPTKGVKRKGRLSEWDDLPKDKSLFNQPPGQGIVIGNLTSQLLSNIYLDQLDRFVTMTLGYKAYGRYVDASSEEAVYTTSQQRSTIYRCESLSDTYLARETTCKKL